MASRFTLPHIEITKFKSQHRYQGVGAGGGVGAREREEHGRRLQVELDAAFRLADAMRPTDDRLPPATTTILEVELRRGTNAEILQKKKLRLRPGASKFDEREARTVALFLPDASREALAAILQEYRTGELTEAAQNPPNKTLVEAIQAFRTAQLATVWTDVREALPENPEHQMWWALWCWPEAEAQIEEVCERIEVRAASKDRRLYFPDVTVVPVLAKRVDIELMLYVTGAIAEIRRATDNPTFFTDEVAAGQHAWSDDLATRTVWPGTEAPSVCIFDTGVNRGHALIEPVAATADLHAVNVDWGVDDHDADGHGTAMAGMALHGDLTAALSDTALRRLTHRLESVKILPPRLFDPNDPASYGVLTQTAISLPEISAPDRRRVYCMAITNRDVSGATPSSWSAAIDQAAAGTMLGDEQDAPRRLIIVAAGNIAAETDPARIRNQDEFPIEDPAQAWNALTVGGYTDLVEVTEEGYESWSPLARAGDLSPHSRTSSTWLHGRTPIKPEIVMEAGNRAINQARTEALTFGSMSLLSTGSDMGTPLVPFEATSAASAQAARLSAKIAADHPDYWPETIRALIVHSAEWTPPMLEAFAVTAGKKGNYEVVRRFGYGVPDYDRATASANNHLALFAQAEIQPFKMEGKREFNNCHYYTLPIPRDLLVRLENTEVELKITLSYFVDPNPGLSGSVEPQRYQSFGLRFDLRRNGEPLETFKKRVNAAEREDPRKGPRVEPDDDRWRLGANSISAGSLHCDTWSGPAIELLGRDTLCIKPVLGWWRDRAGKEYVNKQTRYSLIITFKSKDVGVDLYTPIKAIVDLPIRVGTDIEV